MNCAKIENKVIMVSDEHVKHYRKFRLKCAGRFPSSLC